MTQPLLAIQFRNGPPQVNRIIQSTPVALGNPIAGASAESVLNQNDAHYMNRVVQFENSVYAWQENKVYQLNTGTGVWTAVFTEGFPTGQLGNHSGLHKCDVNGVPSLIGIYNTNPQSKWIGVTFDGTTWTETDLTAFISNNLNQAFHRNFVWKNQLWFEHENGNVYFWDPSTGSVGSTALVTGVGFHDFCVHKNRLYAFGQENTNVRNSLVEFVSGVWFTRVSNITTPNTDNGDIVGHCIFPGGDGFLYVFALVDNVTRGFHVFKCSVANDGTVTPTEITNTVLPAPYRQGGGVAGVISRFWAFVDTETAPGSPPTIWLFFSDRGVIGGVTTLLQWNGPASLMTTIETGGAVEMAFPESKFGGGEYIFTIGENDVIITGRVPVIGGERLSFKLYGGGTRSFRMFFGTNGEAPVTAATLSNPSVGTLSNANHQVDGLTADGTTVYQVTWLANTDGVPNQTRVQRMPRVF